MTDRGGFAALDPCVHCGFCLQACPTFLATGDEADSPRGRIELMRALEAGELAPDDPALALHLDRCLGCRGCEPVCPSGVGYGRGLAAARALIADRRGVPALARLALAAMTEGGVSRVVYALARALRATGLPRRLARLNVAAFGAGDEPIVVNSAGCGAMLKEYGHLLDESAARFAARVKDVTELLAARGPRPGAPIDATVAYDPPCHLLHAQRIAEPPERVLRAIPVLRLIKTPDAAQCCGSAGLFTLVEPAMSRAVLAPKLDTLAEARPQVVATGNPGCLMQLGAGLAAAGIRAVARHPVELLDESYRAAGYYG